MRRNIIASELFDGIKKIRVTTVFHLAALFTFVCVQIAGVVWAAEGRSWRYVSELSQEELYCPREGITVLETGRLSSGKVWA